MAIAMLSRAVHDILDCVPLQNKPVTPDQLRSKTQALDWFNDEDDSGPLSFRGLCNMLGVEPYTILDRLDQKIEDCSLAAMVPKEESSTGTIKKEATDFLQKKLKEFGHCVEVKVLSEGKIWCSDEKLIPICKSLLGQKY